MAEKPKRRTFTINLSDKMRVSKLRTVLGYEAVLRGLSIGQTLVEMVMEAADVDSYPESVRAELAEIESRREERAAQRAAEAAAYARIA